jgi:hypothetical protein
MATLYGQTLTRAELLQRVGDVRQLGGVRLKTLSDGSERGVRVADVSTGSGFSFSVLIDRGMDIGAADWAGRPLAWQSGAGVVHPAFYDPTGLEWLRSFPGGLMVGCGPDNVGVPNVDEGEELGLHGRLSNTPAELLSYGGVWQGDEYTIWVTGQMRHYRVFGANLLLRRTIRTALGANHLRIEDTVTNQGYERTPLQLLYHCNFGYPVVSRDSELWVETERSEPRDAEATKGFDRHTRFEDPTPGYAEQVFLHQPVADASGYARAALVNRAMNFGAYVRFRLAELPNLVQWKMMGQGTYVVGLEPANCGVNGRAADRAAGTLRILEPGETESLAVEIGVLPDAEAIEAYGGG